MSARRRLSAPLAMGCAAFLWSTTALSQAPVIADIVVDGAQRIDPATVMSYMVVGPGDPFDLDLINQSLKSLYATGLFNDVRIERQGGSLLVTVVENPVINQIAFEGNNRIDDETLESEIQLRSRVVYTPARVQADTKRILDLYRRSGRFAARVEPKIIERGQNRVDLAFEIDEGEETGISKIIFVGNREFSDGELRDVIGTQESAWWAFFRVTDTYDPDRLAFDRELLRRHYLSEGYADFQIKSAVAELTPDEEDFILTFTVDEGVRYKFADAKVTAAIRGLDVGQFAKLIEHERGDWYDATEVDNVVSSLNDAVGDEGYAFVDIRPQINRNRASQTIEVDYQIGEGPKVFVERIDIKGNFRTQDEVVRREFRLAEGDAFNTSKIRRSQQRIQNLGFFSKVDVRTTPGTTPDRTVVEVEVEEKSTGELSFGLGFSTAEGPLGDVSIRERNFLGKGQDMRLALKASGESQQIDFGFVEPYFLDRPLAAGINARATQRDLEDETSFNENDIGGGFSLGYEITENLRHRWSYDFSRREVTDVDSSASVAVQRLKGVSYISELSQTLSYDTRDNVFRPTEGYLLSLGAGVAGLGGNTNYVTGRLNGALYVPVYEDDVVVSLSTEAGVAENFDGNGSYLETFYLGGQKVRGFENFGIGPRDTGSDDALGGQNYFTSSLETRFPLGFTDELGVIGRAFVDAGSLWRLDTTGLSGTAGIEDGFGLRASAGVGITWDSPFGPISVDYAWPIVKEDFDKTENFRFSFGTAF